MNTYMQLFHKIHSFLIKACYNCCRLLNITGITPSSGTMWNRSIPQVAGTTRLWDKPRSPSLLQITSSRNAPKKLYYPEVLTYCSSCWSLCSLSFSLSHFYLSLSVHLSLFLPLSLLNFKANFVSDFITCNVILRSFNQS